MLFRSLTKARSSFLHWKLTAIALALALSVGRHGSPVKAQALQTLEGTLDIVWGDPHPTLGSGGETRYTLTLPDGTRQPLQLTGLESQAAQYFGQRVVVSVRAFQNLNAPPDAPAAGTAIVDSIALSPTAQSATSPLASVLGTRSVIFLLVKFSDDTAVPHPPTFYTNLSNPDTPPAGEVFPSTINGFFKKTSWNQFYWSADVGGVGGVGASGGWLTLPHPKSFYANCGFSTSCALLSTLGDDATALGRVQGIDLKNYTNINFVLSNDLDCCAWGGTYYSSVDARSYGATWEPPWGQDVSVYAHEMGHSIGLPHSGWVYSAYDSPWDVMSSTGATAASVICGTYKSANGSPPGVTRNLTCSEPGDGYITPHKDFLGWIAPAYQVVTDTIVGANVSLEADALPLGSGSKMIKICLPALPCTGSSAHFVTVEARVKGLGPTSQFDNGIPGEGIIIHDVLFGRPAISGSCYFNNQSGWAVPIDATPGDYDSSACTSGGRLYPNYALYNAQWTPGQTYTNNTYGLSISVISRTGSTFVVSVLGSLPAAPANVLASPGGGGVVLTWTAAAGATTYTVKRGTVAGAESVLATGIVGTTYTDSTVVKGLRYYYVVSASNGAGQGPNSAEVGITVPLLWPPQDFDGDGKADVTVYRPSTATWWVLKSGGNFATYNTYGWGLAGDVPEPGDYDGDGKLDLAVYRPTTAQWWILWSSTNYATYNVYGWGVGGDTPVPADYDGDGKTDIAVYRPTTGGWWILKSSTGFATYSTYGWGLSGDVPVVGDYDGDGKSDPAIYRPSTANWWILKSSTNYGTYSQYGWGVGGDVPVAADYDGDGKTDLAVYRPTTGGWWILKSSTGFATYNTYGWGLAGDVPVPGDYDGDGKTDPAIYRPATGGWWILKSGTNFSTYSTYGWGLVGDVPLFRRP